MQTLPETSSNRKVNVEPMFWGGHVVVSTEHAGRHSGILMQADRTTAVVVSQQLQYV